MRYTRLWFQPSSFIRFISDASLPPYLDRRILIATCKTSLGSCLFAAEVSHLIGALIVILNGRRHDLANCVAGLFQGNLLRSVH